MQPGKSEKGTRPASTRGRAYEILRAIGPLRKTVRGARRALHRYRVRAWYLKGVARVDGHRLSIVFAGHLESKNYFAHLAFDQEYSERSLGAAWLWNVWRQGIRAGADLVVTHHTSGSHQSQRTERGFCLPCWVGAEADIELATRLCRTSENIKSDVRRANRNGFTYTVTDEPAAIAAFYSNMYVPYVERAHGTRTMLTSWEEFALELGRAELMLLHANGETIAGNLFVDLGGKRVRARALGVKNGDYKYVRMGAVAALYYFELGHLRQKGNERIHYGASRPFLKDGTLGFKKKYGARIVDSDRRIFRIRVARYSDGAKAFLRNNPFISEHDGRFYANFFVNRSTDLEAESLKSDIARYRLRGIDVVRVYCMENARGPLDEGGHPAEPAAVELDQDVQCAASAH